MSARAEEVRRLFAAACDLPAGERAAYLASACGGDAALRAEVAALLGADDAPELFGETGLAGVRQHLRAPGVTADAIAGFELHEVLGRGGMGVVYRATQRHPAREVALKVLAPGLGDPSARRRFELEIEAMARLQHPGIAQIHAAGTFASGGLEQPYLVMERIHGEPADVWAERHRHDRSRCARLLARLAEAVHHAHQRGLIHRDLKPGNVLVTADDQPKVLDFGIARLADAAPADPTRTLAGQVVGTLAYMSPEQAAGVPDAVDVRTDVYSLGALAYQLLAGRLPIEVQAQPWTQTLRQIAECEPPRLGSLWPDLRGDLETIVATAMQKDPERRYDSARAFADDLQRHLRHEPIAARAATPGYRLRRFLRRHALAVTAAAAVVLGLSIALVTSLLANHEIRQAQHEEQRARRTAEQEARVKSAVLQCLQDTFVAADPRETPTARSMTTAQRLASAAARLPQRFADDPTTERQARFGIAKALHGLGELALAEQHYRTVWSTAPAAETALLAEVGYQLADCLLSQGNYQAAMAILDELVGRRGSAPPPVECAILRGRILERLGKAGEAERLWRDQLTRLLADPQQRDTTAVAVLRTCLAGVHANRGEFAAAEMLAREAVPLLVERHGPEAESTLNTLNTLAMLASQRGELTEAGRLLDSVREAWIRVFGEDHPSSLQLLQNHAALQAKLGAVEAATATFESLLEIGARTLGADHPDLAVPHANLGKLLWDKRRLDAAATHYQRAIAIKAASTEGADRVLSGFYYDLARIRRDQGDREQHFQLVEKSLQIRRQALGDLHELVLPRRVEFASLLVERGRTDDALAELQAVDPATEQALGAGHRATLAAARLRAQCHLKLGQRTAAADAIATLERRSKGSPEAAATATVLTALRDELARLPPP